MPNRRTRTSQSKIEDIVQVHQFAKLNDGIFTQYARQNTISKSYRRNTHLQQNLEDDPLILRGRAEFWKFMSSQNIYFQSFAGDNIYFHPTSAHLI